MVKSMNESVFNYLKLQQPLELLNLLENSTINCAAKIEFEEFLKKRILAQISDHLGLDKDEQFKNNDLRPQTYQEYSRQFKKTKKSKNNPNFSVLHCTGDNQTEEEILNRVRSFIKRSR
jgi:hypothetical protein